MTEINYNINDNISNDNNTKNVHYFYPSGEDQDFETLRERVERSHLEASHVNTSRIGIQKVSDTLSTITVASYCSFPSGKSVYSYSFPPSCCCLLVLYRLVLLRNLQAKNMLCWTRDVRHTGRLVWEAL